jgi:hypothetical protein
MPATPTPFISPQWGEAGCFAAGLAFVRVNAAVHFFGNDSES